MKRLMTAVPLLTGIVFFQGATESVMAADPQQAAQLNVQVPVQMNYLLSLPDNYDQQEKWPLVLFLHGKGERGNDLELVKRHGPPKLVAAGHKFPFILISPQCPDDRWWDTFVLNALLDDIIKRYKVDEDRVYCTGLSMGGFGTWNLAAYNRLRFAAIAPICGGSESMHAKYISHIPIWTFHGDQDKAVVVERTLTAVAAIEKEGGKPKLTIYPGVGHNSWEQTYNNPEFYEWLLSHKRPAELPPDPDKVPRR